MKLTFLGSSKEGLFFSLEPYELIAQMDSVKQKFTAREWDEFADRKKKLVNLYQSIDIDDNPIVVVAKLKPF